MIDVVYPYIDHLSSWHELEYSIKSVRKHLLNEHRIWIIGDKPEWLKEPFNYIEHNRVPGVPLTNCFDATSKLETIINHPAISEEFVLMYDDIYLLKPMDTMAMRPLYCMANVDRITRHTNTKHQRLIWSTVDALKKAGIGEVYNCETHMPRVFVKSKMRDIFKRFNPKENRLLTATLYHNWFKEDREPKVIKYNPGIVAYFYGVENQKADFITNQPDEVNQVLNSHLFLNHNDAGLTEVLKKAIEARF